MKTNRKFFKSLEPELVPKFKLFLSVDLVGSTDLKQGGVPYIDRQEYFSRDVWFYPLSKFFSMFHTVFYRELDEVLLAEKQASDEYEYLAASKKLTSDRIVKWRLTGDEVVYCANVHNAEELYPIIVAFKNALIIVRRLLNSDKKFFKKAERNRFTSYRDLLEDAFQTVELDVKGCIWSAGFPITNRMVVVPDKHDEIQEALESADPEYTQLFMVNRYLTSGKSDRKNYLVDYVGPSMDTGFRLAAMATPRKLLISIEVAYLLSKINQTWIDRIYRRIRLGSEFSLCFDGKYSLKGVMGGKPYPVFYVDCGGDEAINSMEDNIRSVDPSLNLRSVCDYCEFFFDKYERFFQRPTIVDPKAEYRSSNRICEEIRVVDKKWKEEKNRILGRLNIYNH